MAPRSCLVLLLLSLVSRSQAACGDEPDKPCNTVDDRVCAGCSGTSDLVPNPVDCNSYYVCNAAVLLFKTPLDCPDGTVFDTASLTCLANGVCKPYCTNAGGSTCSYSCDEDPAGNIALADPYDCTVHSQCTGAVQGVVQQCPSSAPFFDGSACQKDESQCCHCRPYCYTADANRLIADPKDCRRFYACFAATGEAEVSGSCGSQNFDPHLQACSSSVPCITLCTNVMDSNGCIDPYTCTELGYFAKCTTSCVPEYYHCTEISQEYAKLDTCKEGLWFNPDTSLCIKNTTCPYQ